MREAFLRDTYPRLNVFMQVLLSLLFFPLPWPCVPDGALVNVSQRLSVF